MNKEFIPYEQALDLKELGFDEPCFAYYNVSNQELIEDLSNNRTGNDDSRWASAPLYQQAFRWFREKYNLHRRITYYDPIKAQELNHADYQGGIYASAASWFDGSLYIPHDSYWKLENSSYDTYEEIELECLKKLIEIIKLKK
jgi:hypothetical protein